MFFQVFLSPLAILDNFVDFNYLDYLLTDISTYLGLASNFFPVSTLLSAIDIVLQFELLVLSVRFVKWLFRFIPFISSRI